MIKYPENTEFPKFKKLLLAPILKDGMMLQREKPITVWGLAEKGNTVEISFQRGGETLFFAETAADDRNVFSFELPEQKASFDKYSLICKSGGEEIGISDILIGEVFLAAGQSNMEFPLLFARGGKELLKKADNEFIRLCKVTNGNESVNRIRCQKPQFGTQVYWCKGDNGKAMEGMSAIAYSFVREIFDFLGREIPVSFVDISMGGLRLETYLSREQIESLPALSEIIKREGRWFDNWGKRGDDSYNDITGIYNERVVPITNSRFKGVIWYQGEGNLGNKEKADAYVDAFSILVKSFSQCFNDGMILPAVYAMLAPYSYEDLEIGLPTFWEGQHKIFINNQKTMREIPTYDISLDFEIEGLEYPHPIHPVTKLPVGERMATAAKELIYNIGKPYIPPYYEKMEVRDGKVYVTFQVDGKLKTSDGKEPAGFCLCGGDRLFIKSNAEIIDKNTVCIENERIVSPVAVTYAFSDKNHPANLCSEDGIMAVPFRSDEIESVYCWELN